MQFLIILLTLALFTASCGTTNPNLTPSDQLLDPTGELVFKEDEELQRKLADIANAASGKVGVFALLMEENRSVSVNGSDQFAMQSIVKLPVAIAVMKQVNEGKFRLDQKIEFTTDDLVNPSQRSPLRDQNPKGGQATVDELIRLAIVESDGTACDVLTRIAGGTPAVQSYIDSLEIDGMQMRRAHKEFGKSWEMQYENWATPEATVELLEKIFPGFPSDGRFDRSPDASHDVIYQRMLESIPGPNRLKGLLPPGVVVAHKTGTGGSRDGVTSATNDVGIITLPSGKHVAIAVFVGDSSADEMVREAVIAKMAKAVWDKWSNLK